jgi:hypothetical protein
MGAPTSAVLAETSYNIQNTTKIIKILCNTCYRYSEHFNGVQRNTPKNRIHYCKKKHNKSNYPDLTITNTTNLHLVYTGNWLRAG